MLGYRTVFGSYKPNGVTSWAGDGAKIPRVGPRLPQLLKNSIFMSQAAGNHSTQKM